MTEGTLFRVQCYSDIFLLSNMDNFKFCPTVHSVKHRHLSSRFIFIAIEKIRAKHVSMCPCDVQQNINYILYIYVSRYTIYNSTWLYQPLRSQKIPYLLMHNTSTKCVKGSIFSWLRCSGQLCSVQGCLTSITPCEWPTAIEGALKNMGNVSHGSASGRFY